MATWVDDIKVKNHDDDSESHLVKATDDKARQQIVNSLPYESLPKVRSPESAWLCFQTAATLRRFLQI